MDTSANPTPTVPQITYGQLARLFFRLSLIAFGGPVAHIAMVEDEVVRRRGWLTREHYLDLVSAANLIPGPNSTETVIHIGYVMRGLPGAIVAGACFIVPAALLSLGLAALYVASGTLPQVEALLWGIQPVIVAIIAVAAYRLFPAALKNVALWVVFGLALLAAGPLNWPEVILMVGAGLLYVAYDALVARRAVASVGLLAVVGLAPLAQVVEGARAGLGDLFWYFLRIGSVLFGSGYVLVAYIQQDLVNTYGWLTGRELLDAVAIGQFTPGPVLTTATVVGYLVAGVGGAVVATLGIFLPSFVFVILSAPLIPRMRQSRPLSAFLSGVNAGVIAAILVTLVDLGRQALVMPDGTGFSVVALALALATGVALVRFNLNATWMVLLGAVVGLVYGGLV